MRKSAYAGITLALFVLFLFFQWLAGWAEFSALAEARGQAVNISHFVAAMGRETLANWQGQLLQLLWEIAGLAWFLHLGAAAARRQAERVERKLDALLDYLALQRERQDIDREGER